MFDKEKKKKKKNPPAIKEDEDEDEKRENKTFANEERKGLNVPHYTDARSQDYKYPSSYDSLTSTLSIVRSSFIWDIDIDHC